MVNATSSSRSDQSDRPAAAALRKLQREEIAVSLADLDCQIKRTDQIYRQVEIEVYGQPVSG